MECVCMYAIILDQPKVGDKQLSDSELKGAKDRAKAFARVLAPKLTGAEKQHYQRLQTDFNYVFANPTRELEYRLMGHVAIKNGKPHSCGECAPLRAKIASLAPKADELAKFKPFIRQEAIQVKEAKRVLGLQRVQLAIKSAQSSVARREAKSKAATQLDAASNVATSQSQTGSQARDRSPDDAHQEQVVEREPSPVGEPQPQAKEREAEELELEHGEQQLQAVELHEQQVQSMPADDPPSSYDSASTEVYPLRDEHRVSTPVSDKQQQQQQQQQQRAATTPQRRMAHEKNMSDEWISWVYSTGNGTAIPRLLMLSFNGWLNDQVIDQYLKLLENDRAKVMLALPCIFLQETSRPWLERIKDGQRNKAEMILVPINFGGNHWFLFEISLKHKQVNVYDSISHKPAEKIELEYERLYKTDVVPALGEYGTQRKLATFPVMTPSSPKQQKENCGIYLLATAEYISRPKRAKLEFLDRDMKGFRLQIFDQLVNGKVSELKPGPVRNFDKLVKQRYDEFERLKKQLYSSPTGTSDSSTATIVMEVPSGAVSTSRMVTRHSAREAERALSLTPTNTRITIDPVARVRQISPRPRDSSSSSDRLVIDEDWPPLDNTSPDVDIMHDTSPVKQQVWPEKKDSSATTTGGIEQTTDTEAADVATSPKLPIIATSPTRSLRSKGSVPSSTSPVEHSPSPIQSQSPIQSSPSPAQSPVKPPASPSFDVRQGKRRAQRGTSGSLTPTSPPAPIEKIVTVPSPSPPPANKSPETPRRSVRNKMGQVSSPKQVATTSPKRAATTSRKREATPSPKHASTPSPKRAPTTSPKQAATASPKQVATPSPKRAATPSPKQAATPSPKRAATTSPKQAATTSPKRAATAGPTSPGRSGLRSATPKDSDDEVSGKQTSIGEAAATSSGNSLDAPSEERDTRTKQPARVSSAASSKSNIGASTSSKSGSRSEGKGTHAKKEDHIHDARPEIYFRDPDMKGAQMVPLDTKSFTKESRSKYEPADTQLLVREIHGENHKRRPIFEVSVAKDKKSEPVKRLVDIIDLIDMKPSLKVGDFLTQLAIWDNALYGTIVRKAVTKEEQGSTNGSGARIDADLVRTKIRSLLHDKTDWARNFVVKYSGEQSTSKYRQSQGLATAVRSSAMTETGSAKSMDVKDKSAPTAPAATDPTTKSKESAKKVSSPSSSKDGKSSSGQRKKPDSAGPRRRSSRHK